MKKRYLTLTSALVVSLLAGCSSGSESLILQEQPNQVSSFASASCSSAPSTKKVNTSKITKMGFATIDNLNLLGSAKKTNVTNYFSKLNAKFYNFKYENFIIQTKKDADLKTLNTDQEQNLELFYTILAIEKLKTFKPLYTNLVTKAVNPPLPDSLDKYNNWVNKYRYIILSFNDSNDIAVSGTYLGSNPTQVTSKGSKYDLYENLSVISFGSELLKGANKYQGSYPIYKKSTPQENYMIYLNDGLLHSLAHELIHRYVDVRNNEKNSLYNYIYFGGGRSTTNFDQGEYNLEEVIVNSTLDKYFRSSGGVCPVTLDYYDQVRTDNIKPINNFSKYKEEISKFKDLDKNFALVF